MSNRSFEVLSRVTLACVASLSGCTAEVVDAEDMAITEDPILNGSTVAGSATRPYFWEPTMLIDNRGIGANLIGHCSGVALRNDVILTARHCVCTTDNFDGTKVSPSLLTVSHTSTTAGCNSSTCRTVSQIIDPPSTQDVVLLVLSGPLRINGKTYGHSVGIDPLAPGHFRTHTIGVTGYGVNSLNDATGATAGVLRSGTVTVTSTFADWKPNWNPGTRAMVSVGDSNSGGLPWNGDSGAPYWNQFSFNPATTPDSQIAGVIAVHSTADFRDGQRVALSTPHSVFRGWVNDELTARAPVIDDPMTSAAFLSQLEEREPLGVGSIVPRWSVDSQGLIEPSNYSTPHPDRIGTLMIHRTAIYQDFKMSVVVQSTDNDTVGIVFHYVDDNNYLRFSIDQQTGMTRLIRVKPGAVVELANLPLINTINFREPTMLTVTMQGGFIQAFWQGANILSATDQNIFVGRVGIMENAMQTNVHFSQWHSEPL